MKYLLLSGTTDIGIAPPMLTVDTRGNVIQIDNVATDWRPAETYYQMVLFNPITGEYAYVGTLQSEYNYELAKTAGVSTYSDYKVRWSDVNATGRKGSNSWGGGKGGTNDGGYYLDPIFPKGWDDLEWAPVFDPSINGGEGWTPMYASYHGINPIPEPATVTLALLGVAMLGLRRKAKRD